MSTNKSKDSSHKPTVIAGDEEEQLFVLERLTQARKEMNVHKLHVPDLDTLILNRVEALEQNPFGKKRDSDTAAQKAIGDAGSADDEKNSFSLDRIDFVYVKGPPDSFRVSFGMTYEEEKNMYSVWSTAGQSGETFISFAFSPEEVSYIMLTGRFAVVLYMKGEKQDVQLWFVNGKVANAEGFARRLEEQTGIEVERVDG